jgi:hypothetical protein
MAVKKRMEGSSQSPLAERILAQRESGGAEVSLERLEADLEGASRYDIVASLKELEKSGQGQFVVGRKGQRSRFVWGEASGGSTSSVPPAKAPAVKPGRVAKKVRIAKKVAVGSTAAKKVAAKNVSTRRGRGAAANPPLSTSLEQAPALASELSPKRRARKALVAGAGRLELDTSSSHDSSDAARASATSLPPERARERAVRGPSRSLKHSFHLRPGLLIELELPEDVTPSEVERLCAFLKAIPFAGSGR